MRSRRESYREETVTAIVRAGRSRFGAVGYEAAGLEEIAADAGVTTGAIYHHFSSKKGLFLAVAEQIEVELMTRALEVGDPDPWQAMRKAFAKLVDACATAEVQRITFLDAPRVIGREAWRVVELKYAYGAMRSGLTTMTAAGILRPYSIELVAPTLLAVVAEASRAVAAAPEVRDEAVGLVMSVLDALRVPRP